jgi:pimeloyl-ACP methyl ester carboxylesterase
MSVADDRYDELSLFEQNATEFGLPWRGPPEVVRRDVTVAPGQKVSALLWGRGRPELVLLHGGAQNAHTWDTVALALDRPLVAIDLPGHGRSDWRADRDYWPDRNAKAVATAIDELAPTAAAVVGMSLGGLTAFRLATLRPDLVRRLAIVDVTPGTDAVKSTPIAEFVQGPESFASFDELLERTVRYNPTRRVESLRRGLLHNAKPRPDGSWVWRYDRMTPRDQMDFTPLWDNVAAVRVPLLLVRGALSTVVADEDVDELRRRLPAAQVEVVDGAGHSIQGDRPVELAQLIERFVWGTT